jgi:hypothetical protein
MSDVNPLDLRSGVVRMDSIAHLILSNGELRGDVRVLREEVKNLRMRVEILLECVNVLKASKP